MIGGEADKKNDVTIQKSICLVHTQRTNPSVKTTN